MTSHFISRETITRLSLLLVVVFVLSFACTTDAPQVEPTSTSEPTSSPLLEGVEIVDSLPPTAEGETIVEPLNPMERRRGGVLAVPTTHCPVPDPAIDSESALLSLNFAPMVPEIHAGLTKTVDIPVKPFELELAESYSVSLDGLEYEFILRKDLKFSDSSPLTSSDFKWSWERSLKKSEVGTKARDVFGLIEGAEEVISGETEELTGVIAVDDRTLTVRLTNPRADFPALLADPVASVLKKDNVLSWGIAYTNSGGSELSIPFNEHNMPVGAGPFRLVVHWEHSQNGRCAIERNPYYWGEPAFLDGVWYRTDAVQTETTEDGWMTISPDPMAFIDEVTDFEELPRVISVEDADDEEETEAVIEVDDVIEVDGAVDAVAHFPPRFVFVILNPMAPPFDDIHFRRAASAYSRLTTRTQIVDADARLITEELTTLQPRAEFLRYDEELAQAELANSKYGDSEEEHQVTVLQSRNLIVTDMEVPSFVEWAQDLNLELTEDLFGTETLDEFDGRRNNQFHMRIIVVSPSYPDPITVLRTLTSPFGNINRAPEFARLEEMLTTASTELDTVKRHELFLDIEQYVAEQALVIPIEIFPATSNYRHHSWVHDLNPPKYPGSIFHRVWLDDTAPKRELPTQ